MTREDLFRAVGEVREDQIEAAETVKKQTSPWRRFGVLAACLAVAVAGTAPWLGEQMKWWSVERGFEPALIEKEESGSDAGGGTSAGSLDGSKYWADNPAQPGCSTGMVIGELAGPGNGDTMMGMSACLAWLSPEEIFAQDTVIFRGTVRELQYFIVEPDTGSTERYYTRAIVDVTDSIRGDLTAGETYSVLWLGAKGYMSTSISGSLEDLDVGSDAVFMPVRTDQNAGWKEGDSCFYYADLAEFYLSEGVRYVFADTAEGLIFDRSVYKEIVEAGTLDEVAAYIREQIGEEEPKGIQQYIIMDSERTQPAAEPAAPQAEPSETANAGPSASGPSGARALPGGAVIGGERADASP